MITERKREIVESKRDDSENSEYCSLVADAIQSRNLSALTIFMGPNFESLNAKFSISPYLDSIKLKLEEDFYTYIEEAILSLEELFSDRNDMKIYEDWFINPIRQALRQALIKKDPVGFDLKNIEAKKINDSIKRLQSEVKITEEIKSKLQKELNARTKLLNEIAQSEELLQTKNKIIDENKYARMKDYFSFYDLYQKAYNQSLEIDPRYYSQNKKKNVLFREFIYLINFGNSITQNSVFSFKYINFETYHKVINSLNIYIKKRVLKELKSNLRSYYSDFLEVLSKQRHIEKDKLDIHYKFLLDQYNFYIKTLKKHFFNEFEPMKLFKKFEEFQDGVCSYDFGRFKLQLQNHITQLKLDIVDSYSKRKGVSFFMNSEEIEKERESIVESYKEKSNECVELIKKSQSKFMMVFNKSDGSYELARGEIINNRKNMTSPNRLQDACGNTLMHYAVFELLSSVNSEYPTLVSTINKIIAFLVSHGLSLNAKNNNGETPFEFALNNLKLKSKLLPLYKLITWDFAGLMSEEILVMSRFCYEVRSILLSYISEMVGEITDDSLEAVMFLLERLDESYHNASDKFAIEGVAYFLERDLKKYSLYGKLDDLMSKITFKKDAEIEKTVGESKRETASSQVAVPRAFKKS